MRNAIFTSIYKLNAFFDPLAHEVIFIGRFVKELKLANLQVLYWLKNTIYNQPHKRPSGSLIK